VTSGHNQRPIFADTMPGKHGARYRHFCWTLHSERWTEDTDLSSVFPEPPAWCSYCIFSLERCPKTGRLHLQGYSESSTQVTLDRIKREFNGELHVEPRFGTQEQAIAYCSKSDTHVAGPYFWGTPSKQGSRTDISSYIHAVESGSSEDVLMHEYPVAWSRYPGLSQRVRDVVRRPVPRLDLKVLVVVGETACGKSHAAYHAYPDAFRMWDNYWWDGYNGQRAVVWDDFRSDGVTASRFLNWTDKWPVSVPIKGSHRHLDATRFLITSNDHPTFWFGGVDSLGPSTAQALLRRLQILKADSSWSSGDVGRDAILAACGDPVPSSDPFEAELEALGGGVSVSPNLRE